MLDKEGFVSYLLASSVVSFPVWPGQGPSGVELRG